MGIVKFPIWLEFLEVAELGMSSPEDIVGTACLNDVHLRFLNISMNKFSKVLCSGCRLEGVNRIEVLDLSHGALELITPKFMHSFVNLRYFNLSHNALGVSGSDFRDIFSRLRSLEDINLSHNKLRRISPVAFEHCARLKLLNLANNELTHIDIYMNSLRDLEFIDLSDNRLMTLSDAFMSRLNERVHVRPLVVDLQREMFTCNCDSLSFVRWTRVTHVRLASNERLTCSYGDIRDKPLSHIDLDIMQSECRVPSVLPIVLPIVAVVVFICLLAVLLRYHRWYIKYHLVLCWLREKRTSKIVSAAIVYVPLIYPLTNNESDSTSTTNTATRSPTTTTTTRDTTITRETTATTGTKTTRGSTKTSPMTTSTRQTPTMTAQQRDARQNSAEEHLVVKLAVGSTMPIIIIIIIAIVIKLKYSRILRRNSGNEEDGLRENNSPVGNTSQYCGFSPYLNPAGTMSVFRNARPIYLPAMNPHQVHVCGGLMPNRPPQYGHPSYCQQEFGWVASR